MERETDWTSGYVTELEYTYGYYRELCPGLAASRLPERRHRAAFDEALATTLNSGSGRECRSTFTPPRLMANSGALTLIQPRWRMLGRSPRPLAPARSCLRILLPSLRPADLPEFDIIGLHGIWTWISDENSRVIVDLIRRKLRAGGIVYISYNCLPGWAPAVPLRHLMKLHADFAAEASGLRAKLDGAMAFAQQVINSGALFFRGNPAVAERLKRMSEHGSQLPCT